MIGPDAATRLVERSCRSQGLPATVEDGNALARVAAVLSGRRAGNDEGGPQAANATTSHNATLATRGAP